MAISIFPGVKPLDLLDTVQAATHFGPGGRPRGQQWKPAPELLARFDNNRLLKDIISPAIEHFGTQGDGNHFAYVGTLKIDRRNGAGDPSRFACAGGSALLEGG